VIRFLANLSGNPATPTVKGQEFLDILIVAVTIIVVAVPEGLPLAVTLALAFATTRMLKENNLVRVLRACETMGNATTICSDKTGTLTQNKMTVVAGAFGLNEKFAQSSSLEEGSTTASFAKVFRKLSMPFKELLTQSIAVNSTAFEGEENGQKTFIGSKTETALLVMAKDHLALANVAEERSNTEIVQLIPFDSARKCMGAVISLPSGGYRMVVKGAAELMLAKADSVVSGLYDDEFGVDNLSVEEEEHIASHIYAYAERSLRTIGFLYKDFAHWPPIGARTLEGDKNMADFDDIFTTMTWIGVVGIQDPLRPQVTDAVRRCQMAGIKVRMVTGDNRTTANAIAIECGIKTEDGIVMEGPVFRQLSDEQMDAVIPNLDVLARSSPEDKRILVERLKKLGETVAVTGDGTNDGPALKTADVGFSMGIVGTEVAKEASEIILMDDNFASIVKAVMWGRSVNDAVAKFLQFQITVNISAVILAFVSAVSNSDNHSVLSAVQLLWVNLVMDTFAALALATDAPTDKILDRKPAPKSAPLITIRMWKMIIGQAIYQLVVTFVLYFAGTQILNYNTDLHPELRDQLNTMVFNTFVWMQIFNEFNNRRLDNKFNIFEGVHKNWFFIGINCIMVGGQILIVFIGGRAFQVTKIDGTQWAICILSALPCLLWAVVLRIIPDRWAEVVFAAAIKAFLFVFAPVWKVVRIIFHPVGKAWRAVVAPTKRFSARMWAKAFGKKNKGDAKRADEEAVSSDPEQLTTPTRPFTNLPPITLTTPDQDDLKS
jgi:Ca2+-transporting ATPase